MIEPEFTLKQLGLSDSEISVYLAMVSGRKKAREIVQATGEKRPTVYYALGALEKRGLITKSTEQGNHDYILLPLKNLELIVKEKQKETQSLLSSVKELAQSFSKQVEAHLEVPVVTFYQGKQAVKNIVMESLYCKSKKIETIIPKQNFFIELGEAFAKKYVGERIQREITTRNLWTFKTTKEIFSRYYTGKSDVRLLPKSMHEIFTTSILIYDDTVLYLSSLKNSYCVKIVSKEQAETMRALFTGLWSASTPYEKAKQKAPR